MTEEQSDSVSAVAAAGGTDFSATHESLAPVPRSGPTATARSAATRAPPAVTSPSSATAASPARSVSSTAVPNPREVQAAVNRANVNLANYNRVLDFQVDAGTGLSVARIRNAQTGEVLQQIPSTDLLQLAQLLADWSPGKDVLIDLIA